MSYAEVSLASTTTSLLAWRFSLPDAERNLLNLSLANVTKINNVFNCSTFTDTDNKWFVNSSILNAISTVECRCNEGLREK